MNDFRVTGAVVGDRKLVKGYCVRRFRKAYLVSSPGRICRSMSIVDLSGKRCKSARATASPTTPRVSDEEEISACAVAGYTESNMFGAVPPPTMR